MVQLCFCEWWIGRIHHHRSLAYLLQQSLCLLLITLLLYVTEVGCFFLLVLKALLMAIKHNVIGHRLHFTSQISYLWRVFQG